MRGFPNLDVSVHWGLVTPEEAAEAHELRAEDWLAAPERAALDALTVEGRRREWCAGRLAVKRAVQRWCSETSVVALSLAEVRIAQDERGAPHAFLPQTAEGPPVSIAHSDGYGFAAVAAPGAGVRVGVDIERVRDIHPRLLARLLGPDEDGCATVQPLGVEPLDGVTLWTLKEATVKALGVGLRLPMRCLRVLATAPGRAQVCRIAGPPTVDDFATHPWTATGAYTRTGNLALAIVTLRRVRG